MKPLNAAERLAELRKRARLLKPETKGNPEEIRKDALKHYYAWADLRERANRTMR